MISISSGKKNGLLNYTYVFSYIISLFALFMQLTMINGNTLYVFNPTSNTFIDSICNAIIYLSIGINLILFISSNSVINNQFRLYFVIFMSVLVCFSLSKILHISVISTPCFLFYLLILNSKLFNPNKFIKIDFVSKLIIISLIIILYFNHYFPSNNIPTFIRGKVIRYSLGFSYPTILASAVLGIILSFVLAYGNHLNNAFLIIIIGVVGIYFFHLTDTRGLEVSIVFLMILLSLEKWDRFRIVVEKYIPYFLITFLIVSILCIFSFKYSLPFSYKLNALMSDRLYNQLNAINAYHIKLIGNVLPSIDTYTQNNIISSTVIDNGFISFLITYGLIGTALYEFFFIGSGIISKKNHNYLLSCILLIMATQFLFETDYDKVWMIAPLIYAFSQNSITDK